MVRVSIYNGIVQKYEYDKKIVVKLFADTKEEVTDQMQVVGLPAGYDIAAESYVMTASGDVGIMDSTGTWNWVGEEEEGTRSVSSLTKSAPVEMRQEEPTEEVKREEPEEIEEPIEDEDDMR